VRNQTAISGSIRASAPHEEATAGARAHGARDDVERAEPVPSVLRHLRPRQVELRIGRRRGTARSDVAGHADHNFPRRIPVGRRFTAFDPLPKRILTREGTCRERFVDDHDALTVGAIVVGKRPSLQSRRSHRRKESGGRHAKNALNDRASIGPFGDQAVGSTARSHRGKCGYRRRSHAGYLHGGVAEAVDCSLRGRIGIGLLGQREARRKDTADRS
jgi:hypothetical protein